MKKLGLLGLVVGGLALAGCGAEEDSFNVAIYDAAIMDIIDDIGYDKFEIDTLGVPHFLMNGDIEKYASEENVDLGSHNDLDIEPIKLLQPDLVIMGGRHSSLEDQIKEEMNNEVDYYLALIEGDQVYIDRLQENVEKLGEFFPQVKDELDTKLVEIKEEIAEVTAITETMDEEVLVVMSDGDVNSVFGTNSRFDVIFNTFGFNDVFESSDYSCGDDEDGEAQDVAHGCTFDSELFNIINPDILFVIERGILREGAESAGIEALRNSAAYQGTTAGQNDEFHVVDGASLYLMPGSFRSTSVIIENLKQGLPTT